MQADAVVVAAGKGRRLGDQLPKQFIILHDKPILAHTLAIFARHSGIARIVVVGPADWLSFVNDEIVARFHLEKIHAVIAGGRERQDSVLAGVKALPATGTHVLVHDGARPFASAALIDRVLDGLADVDCCIPALPCADTIKRVHGEWVAETLPRDELRLVQTPQGFERRRLLQVLARAATDGVVATDEAALIEKYGGTVRWVDGERRNIKITTQFDLQIAKSLLNGNDT